MMNKIDSLLDTSGDAIDEAVALMLCDSNPYWPVALLNVADSALRDTAKVLKGDNSATLKLIQQAIDHINDAISELA